MEIASAFGIPIRLHWSFLAVLAGILVWAGPGAWIGTLGLTIGLFGSVLLHELGHALAARYYGIETAHITLYPFGGVAAITQMPRNPLQAGLFVVFGALYLTLGSWVAGGLAMMNLAMGLFNLIPAFPMDGGRVLRALLATRMGWM